MTLSSMRTPTFWTRAPVSSTDASISAFSTTAESPTTVSGPTYASEICASAPTNTGPRRTEPRDASGWVHLHPAVDLGVHHGCRQCWWAQIIQRGAVEREQLVGPPGVGAPPVGDPRAHAGPLGDQQVDGCAEGSVTASLQRPECIEERRAEALDAAETRAAPELDLRVRRAH